MSLRGGDDAHFHRTNAKVTHCALKMLDSAIPERDAACSVGWCNSDRKSDRRGEALECLHSFRRWTFRFGIEPETPQLNTGNDSDKMYIAVGVSRRVGKWGLGDTSWYINCVEREDRGKLMNV